MDKDLYEILGVAQGANESEIRKAFHKLARQYHPDVNQGDPSAEQKFKEVNLAYEVLKDKEKRAKYDQMRAMGANPFSGSPGGGGPRPGGGPGGGGFRQGGPFGDVYGDFGLGDLFEEIFGGGPRRNPGRRPPGGGGFQRRGSDQETSLNISFMEAVQGGERFIELTDGRKLTVRIPSGVRDGSKIKLKGQGESGIGGGPAGDLLLVLKVMPHPYFRREGNDIHLKAPITFSEAVLGAEIEVPTVSGKVHVKIPAGISSGQRLKLTGKGVKTSRGTGDQHVEVVIRVPKPPSTAYQEAAESLQKDGFDPRTDW